VGSCERLPCPLPPPQEPGDRWIVLTLRLRLVARDGVFGTQAWCQEAGKGAWSLEPSDAVFEALQSALAEVPDVDEFRLDYEPWRAASEAVAS